MPGISNLSVRACSTLLTILLATALLIVWSEQLRRRPAKAAGTLDDWNIRHLVEYLNGKGLGLRGVATQEKGGVQDMAFLTITNKSWEDLNMLPNDERQIMLWRGTLCCSRNQGREFCSEMAQQWGDGCLIAGPFLLYGDRELLGRVRAALTGLDQ